MSDAPMKDYYGILRVPRDAPVREIRRAYRREAFRWHPDRNPGREEEACRRFLDVREALVVLSDPVSRGRYDRRWFAEQGTAGAGALDFEEESGARPAETARSAAPPPPEEPPLAPFRFRDLETVRELCRALAMADRSFSWRVHALRLLAVPAAGALFLWLNGQFQGTLPPAGRLALAFLAGLLLGGVLWGAARALLERRALRHREDVEAMVRRRRAATHVPPAL